jgi:CDP-diacylglycerol pyrophosphatase
MMVLGVALVLIALVVAVVLVGATVRTCAVCPRRGALVKIVDERCQHRAICLDAPTGCERDCIRPIDFAVRGA